MVLKTLAGRAYILRQRSTSWQKSPSNSNPRRRQSAHKTLAVRSPAICAEILAVRLSHWPPLLFCTGGLALPQRPGQQSLPDAAALAFPPAVASRWLFATAPRPAPALASSSTSAPGQSSRRPDQSSLATRPAPMSRPAAPPRRPASNKPNSAEKSTPVWLAIWRTWAGFANSQLWCATFRCTYSYICTHPRYCRLELLLRQTQIFRPICTDCLRHLRISAE